MKEEIENIIRKHFTEDGLSALKFKDISLEISNLFKLPLDIAESVFTVCLVPHGYQIDIIDYKAYLKDEIKVIHSECRDYGSNLDVNEFSLDIINFIRKGKDGGNKPPS